MVKYHDLKVVRQGSSNVVVITKRISEEMDITPGDFLRLSIQKMKLVPAEESTPSSKRKNAISGKVPRNPRLFSGKLIKAVAPVSEPAHVIA